LKQILASVISNAEVIPGTYLIWLEAPQIASTTQPGQFIMVRCGEDTLLRRPLSVHQRDGNKIALLFAIVGKGSRWLSQRQIGDTIDIFGPLGNGFSINPDSQNLLLVAGGIGIAPLCFLAQQALNQGRSVTLLQGAATAAQLYPRHLSPPETEFIIATEDGTAGKKGMITEFLADFCDWADQVFACGPVGMYRSMAALRGSIPKPAQISLEMRMACGYGVCYGCTLKTKDGLKQVCKDGPIFDLDDIRWDELTYSDY